MRGCDEGGICLRDEEDPAPEIRPSPTGNEKGWRIDCVTLLFGAENETRTISCNILKINDL